MARTVSGPDHRFDRCAGGWSGSSGCSDKAHSHLLAGTRSRRSQLARLVLITPCVDATAIAPARVAVTASLLSDP